MSPIKELSERNLVQYSKLQPCVVTNLLLTSNPLFKTKDTHYRDTSGRDRFSGLRENFYRGSHGAIFCFDVTERTSFKNVEKWIRSVEDHFPGIHNINYDVNVQSKRKTFLRNC